MTTYWLFMRLFSLLISTIILFTQGVHAQPESSKSYSDLLESALHDYEKLSSNSAKASKSAQTTDPLENKQPEIKSPPHSTNNSTLSPTADKYYAPLESALHDYEKLAASGGWPKWQAGKSIKIGMSDKRIGTLKQILKIMGDYQGSIDDSDKPQVLDNDLSEAVKRFQNRHGLEPDGAVGKQTQAALAVSVDERITQIKTTLARLRDMPDLGNRYILVNVAGFFLKAVSDGKTEITSRIIAGNRQNHTPLFRSEIINVVFNPKWYVPARIAREEIVVKQRENGNYLKKGNFIVKTQNGKDLNIDDVNWESDESESYRFIQRSGDGNALGRIKFNLPNKYGVYLHYTSTPRLFSKAERAFSHGCMRVERAHELAYFVFNGYDGWDKEKIDKAYASTTTRYVDVPPVPVLVTYLTSWVDEDDKTVNFRNDIYGIDRKTTNEIEASQTKTKGYY